MNKRLVKLSLLFLCVIGLLGCQSTRDYDYQGQYEYTEEDGHYILLREDSSFELFQKGVLTVGTYKVKLSTINLYVDGKWLTQGKIRNGYLTDSDGERWVKKSNNEFSNK